MNPSALRRGLVAAFAAASLFLIASPASAQSPGVIYACVHKASEQVRIVPASEVCKDTESRMSWNSGGAKGDKGDKGDTGAPGAPGAKGDKGDPGAGLNTGSVVGQAISCSGGLAGAMAYLAGESFVAITASDGGFRLSYVPPGNYNLVLESPGGATASRPGVAVATGATTAIGVLSINDLMTDPANCGACGNVCAAGQVCSNGQCNLNCVGGTTHCGNACVSTQTDPSNCGACGNACGPGQICSNSACTLSCAGGTTKCGNACVSTQTDPSNCGACGFACAQGQSCVNSTCANLAPCAGSGICQGVRIPPSSVCTYPGPATTCSVAPLGTCNGLGTCVLIQ